MLEKTSPSLSAAETAAALPYTLLAQSVAKLLADPSVQVPARQVLALPSGASLFVMPAFDERVAITKLISFVASNPAHGRPAIQGDVVVFDAQTGERRLILHGPTVTARRTAAVSLLAAQHLAPCPQGPLLIVGAGVQGRAHLEAFHQGLGVQEVWVASRTPEGAQALVRQAQQWGLQARVCQDLALGMAHCPLVVSATPAQQVVLQAHPRDDAWVCAVGAFTPRMVEWAPEVVVDLAQRGRVVVDTRDADHEAGDLLQAHLPVSDYPTLAQVLQAPPAPQRPGPVLFKSCGWAGWDLAAARCWFDHRVAQQGAA